MTGIIKKIIRQGDAVYIVLLAPYAPLSNADKGVAFVDSFYPASNAVYHAKKELIADLTAKGFSPSKYQGSYKRLLVELGIGSFLKNQLVYIEEFGTFFAVEIIVLAAGEAGCLNAEPVSGQKIVTACINCGECIKACPAGALGEEGYRRERCLRQLQCAALNPGESAAEMLGNSILGCNRCQTACPLNSGIAPRGVTAEEAAYFELRTFYRHCFEGNFDWYRAYIGTNFAKKMRLAGFIVNAMTNNPGFDYSGVLERYDGKDECIKELIAQYLYKL